MTAAGIEQAALQSLHGAADAGLRKRLGVEWRAIGAGAASIAAGLPASAIVVNRALGLTDAGAAEAMAAYREAGVARFFLNGDHPGLTGLLPARPWAKFLRGREAPVPDLPAPLPLRPLGPDDGPAFGVLVAAAFDLGEVAVPWLARLPAMSGWRLFGAFDGAVLAGVGGLFVRGRTGWTDWGATRPDYRGRGVQLSLLAHRVRAALSLGLARIETCTGCAVPGEPQHSYANILRCGFAETGIRPNWAPPRAAPLANRAAVA
ncbi:MAG: hypothetical protein ACK4KW_11550 [Gemmobacter sp.]